MSDINPNQHVLKQLVFPARYEALVERLGPELVSLLVTPETATKNTLEDAAYSVISRGEGALLPLYAPSGTGKTTLANNLSYFLPQAFSPTVVHNGDVTDAELRESTRRAIGALPANDKRIVPINIDHREGNPPSGSELAEMKRFLRTTGVGSRSIILWPDTSGDVSRQISTAYEDIAGSAPVEIPIEVQGPVRETWRDVASNTLRLANDIDSLEGLGVDPRDYDPNEFRSIGDFLRKISGDFTRRKLDLQRSVQKQLRLAIVWASKSADAGVLVQLTSSTRFGLLDASALLDATKNSVIGKWWAARRGLLTQVIVQLDARLFCLPPTASITVLRRYGPESTKQTLSDLDVRLTGDQTVHRNLTRTDLGKYLSGEARATYETRGTPSNTSIVAFELLSEVGFTAGKDKTYNSAMASALRAFYEKSELKDPSVKSEEKLSFCPLIPDNSVEFDDEVVCIEYTWRTGDFLTPSNRSTIAQYCLTKLRNYSRELGWTTE